jgi:hypothetical protein
VPADPLANAGGCVTTSTVCNGSAGLYCVNETCQDYVGCIGRPRDCSGNYTNGSCDTYNCSEADRECTLVAGACFDFLGGAFGFASFPSFLPSFFFFFVVFMMIIISFSPT